MNSWLTRASGQGRVLCAIDRDDRYGGLRQAVVEQWDLLNSGGVRLRGLFRLMTEAALQARADQMAADGLLERDGFGYDPGAGNWQAKILETAAHLRLLETELVELYGDDAPSDPEKTWRVSTTRGDHYLIPTSGRLWVDAPAVGGGVGEFDFRGISRHRIVPCEVDGARVRLVRPGFPRVLSRDERYGAALFPDATLRDEEAPGSSGARIVVGLDCPRLEQVIDQALLESDFEGVAATVFPELTIDEATLKSVQSKLRLREWRRGREHETFRPPMAIVAGSRHLKGGDGTYANVATVFSAAGEEMASPEKRFPFKGSDGWTEAVRPAEEILLFVADNCLIAFGICLDFAYRNAADVYAALDVDLVIVPSLGGNATMSGHLASAKNLWLGKKARALVVQQSNLAPAAETTASVALGWILWPCNLPVNSAYGERSEEEFASRSAWNMSPGAGGT